MPITTELVVVIVREPGLRSLITARLTLSGASVITAASFDDPALVRARRRNRGGAPLLVIDEASIDDEMRASLEDLVRSGAWRGVVVLIADEADIPARTDQATYVRRDDAYATIAALLEISQRDSGGPED